MAYVSSLDWNSLAPHWVSVYENFTADDTLSVTEGGRKIQSIGGNNGNSAKGFVKGTARGSFKIQFKLGYTWGWSEFEAANVTAVTSQSSSTSANYNVSGYNGVQFLNNSSNNSFRVYKSVSGTSSTVTSVTGISDVMITLWRDNSNVVKYKAGSETAVTIGTFSDHWAFYCGAQSPCSVELISACNMYDVAS